MRVACEGSVHCKNGSVYGTLLVCISSECVLHTIFVSMCTPHVCHAHLSFYSVVCMMPVRVVWCACCL